MNIISWLQGRFSTRGKAMSLYQRGMQLAKKHDKDGAIAQYTAAIKLPDVPGDVKAMALYNRALVHVAAGNEKDGTDDLRALLGMHEAPENVKNMARQKLARMDSRSKKDKS